MGWKTSAIVIVGIPEGSLAELLEQLGFPEQQTSGEVTVDEAFYPEGLFAGTYQGATLIFEPELPWSILENPDDPSLRTLLTLFPLAVIGVFGLQSTVNAYGYRLFEAGRERRALVGSADTGVEVDEGDPSEAEKRALSPYTRRSSEEGEELFEDASGETFTLDQLGEEIVFEVISDLVGERPDRSESFMAARVTRFTERERPKPARKWWQLW